jgi:hypothetical protein
VYARTRSAGEVRIRLVGCGDPQDGCLQFAFAGWRASHLDGAALTPQAFYLGEDMIDALAENIRYLARRARSVGEDCYS